MWQGLHAKQKAVVSYPNVDEERHLAFKTSKGIPQVVILSNKDGKTPLTEGADKEPFLLIVLLGNKGR